MLTKISDRQCVFFKQIFGVLSKTIAEDKRSKYVVSKLFYVAYFQGLHIMLGWKPITNGVP